LDIPDHLCTLDLLTLLVLDEWLILKLGAYERARRAHENGSSDGVK
jgi:hypothetical protein